jgi:transcriptional regulator with XRE-family HTH domain
MDQKKIGGFLKSLRQKKGLTQEQLAEQFYVSARTVSRWETGNNMPDLSILIDLADFYEVEIEELIAGERKSENMNEKKKNTLKQVAEYSQAQRENLRKEMFRTTGLVVAILLVSFILDVTDGFGLISKEVCRNVVDFAAGMSLSVLVFNMLYLHGTLDKIRAWKLARFHRQH